MPSDPSATGVSNPAFSSTTKPLPILNGSLVLVIGSAPASRSKMAGGRVAHVTLKGPSVVKELVIATILGCLAGGLWKMHHWNEQRRTRAFCNYLPNCLSAHPNYLLKKPVENSLRDAKLSFKDIDEVIHVGGSTRIPAVQGVVKSLTGKEPNVIVNPDEVVALGDAVQIRSLLFLL